MLTPTDIHFLVGLLSRMSHPDAVEVELGSMIWDEASESHRDVDVTISMKDSAGGISVFTGIEVKAHSRKLGTEAVEQLAQKLKDMPAVTKRAIVSASGFTKPSIKKAQKHGIELFELKDWSASQFFPYFRHEPSPSVCVTHQWASIHSVKLIHAEAHSNGVSVDLDDTQPVYLVEGASGLKKSLPLGTWKTNLCNWASKSLVEKTAPIDPTGALSQAASVIIKLTDVAWIEIGNREVLIKEVHISGIFEKSSQVVPSVMKALLALGAKEPISGCCVSEFAGSGLVALMFHNSGIIECALIPISERNREKILRHSVAPARPFDSQ